MEDMLATLPRVISVSAMSAGCLPSQDLATGGQIVSGFRGGNQEDPRSNGTLRKQASPRPGTQGAVSALTAGQGKAEGYPRDVNM